MGKLKNREEFAKLSAGLKEKAAEQKKTISICAGTGCLAYGSGKIIEAFEAELQKQGLADSVRVLASGCHGFCERGPLVVIRPLGVLYTRVQEKHIEQIVSETVKEGKIIEELLYVDPATGAKIEKEAELPFYKKQTRIIFGDNGHIRPTSIEDYLGIGGYEGLVKALFEMNPDQIIEDIKKSGLRGRGGGGFPAGRKWESCKKAKGDIRYVVCNADEGDPGAYMDRSLLEGNPHRVLEGMIIAAYAIGSSEGYVYVRNEYPLACENIRIAIDQAKEYGLLGENILGSGFSFDVFITKGGGAFVCGESSALMQSLEDKLGEPRAKYIHTVERGFRDQPTSLNNVETYANVPHIINRGVDWYTSIGTERSKGTKIFSLVGKIVNTGLVEVPMGITLREIIFDIGGGIGGGKKFKAVQTGGPSGGCLSEAQLDLPVDFDVLTEHGSMMGSGGMIVMDESTCMVDLARYFIDFLVNESCGKCVPCREGLKQMLKILTEITQGKGKEGDVELLISLCDTVKSASLCALGQSAPNPVLSTINYFRDEYDAHIKQKKCPGKVCKALIKYSVSKKECTGCGACARVCPTKAATGEKKQTHVIDQKLCIKCGACLDACKFNSIIVK